MHRYEPSWPEDRAGWEPPSPADFTYRDACDVAAFAAIDPLTTWRTWPEVWHLDDHGAWRCCSTGSSLDSVRRFAKDPAGMLECRLTPMDQSCPDHWVILEPRHAWLLQGCEVTEADAEAFVALRSSLAVLGITLLDALIFDPDHRWWSLHELTSGSTVWDFAPARRAEHRKR